MTDPTITPAEYAALRFPGSVPGLLRLGSPTSHGIVVWTDSECVRCVPASGPNTVSWLAAADSVSIDLLDATGRAHLAWWIAARCGAYPHEPALFYQCVNGWEIGSDGGYWAAWSREIQPDEDGAHRGPVLAHLDPNDPRLLPDGSRLVDALALAAVGRHVAGLEVTGG